MAKYPNTIILQEVSIENKPALRVGVIKATHKNYGYSLTVVEGEKPSYILGDWFMWFKHKSDAQNKKDKVCGYASFDSINKAKGATNA